MILLSKTSQYALRAMDHLAHRPKEVWLPAMDLSREMEIPQTYLSKILRRLVEAKLLKSEKGHHGGFRLARSADKIRIGEILEALGENLTFRTCCLGWKKCNPKRQCPMHPVFAEFNELVLRWANEHTLASQATPPVLKRLPPRPRPVTKPLRAAKPRRIAAKIRRVTQSATRSRNVVRSPPKRKQRSTNRR